MRSSVVVTMVVAGVLGLAGCTGGDDPEPSGTGSAAADAPGGTVQQAGTVFDATFPVPGDPDAAVRVEVEPLVVQGKTMELRVWFTPDDDSLADGETVNIYGMTGDGDLRPALNDLEHLTQYFVLSETGQYWETDNVSAKAADGERVLYQAWFAAPTEQVEALDLSLVASWAPFENVPVTYED
ncbi:hypothetical protein [Cellulomonas sp. Leaf334]|uniref:hypothetical protein n=1 Tax=Cellulomonas sp. Leaf334 TaxID=1736339 RepID=UPI0006F7E787|nr:hypothetical protein [Cellulomonas sp. Leaf334]KQR17325.1 hypothetical protein ASF78_08545 [Cellulomonas sp. Leaf334]